MSDRPSRSRATPPGETVDPADPEVRAQMKQWVEQWARVGPILEQERWDRLAAMTDEEAREAAVQVLSFWSPDWPTRDGEELLLHQRVFARALPTV